MYGLLSGATHGRVWFMQGLQGSRDDLERFYLLPLLDVSDRAVETACWHVGLKPDIWLKETHFRRVALRTDLAQFAEGWETYASRRRSGRVSKWLAPDGYGASFGGVFRGSGLQRVEWGDSGLNRGPTDYESAALTD
ncbi:hypothetical protein N803_00395 [Knoellia subterranea KCTC 19937]|uniref:Uncharacterized protein n=1 Tax=Knoellia subterranea KCTC 19937 TaxID=1385521 RepID=A0A0A0JQ45_9MICO|nr:hypothetical protein N803_00395 [Knoellia subterranea KCTC 19937]